MYKSNKKIVRTILKDPKHWLGWAITVGAIIGVFHLLGVHLHTPYWHISVLLGVVVFVDLIKHRFNLQ